MRVLFSIQICMPLVAVLVILMIDVTSAQWNGSVTDIILSNAPYYSTPLNGGVPSCIPNCDYNSNFDLMGQAYAPYVIQTIVGNGPSGSAWLDYLTITWYSPYGLGTFTKTYGEYHGEPSTTTMLLSQGDYVTSISGWIHPDENYIGGLTMHTCTGKDFQFGSDSSPTSFTYPTASAGCPAKSPCALMGIYGYADAYVDNAGFFFMSINQTVDQGKWQFTFPCL